MKCMKFVIDSKYLTARVLKSSCYTYNNRFIAHFWQQKQAVNTTLMSHLRKEAIC